MSQETENIFTQEEYKIKLNNLEKTKNEYKKINNKKEASITIEFEQKSTGIMYTYLASKTNKKVNIMLNGNNIIDITNQNDYFYNILELGTFEPNTPQQLTIELLDDTIKLENIEFYTLNIEKLEEITNKLNKEELTIEKSTGNYIKAKIKVEENNKILYTSIPYDKGFEIKVNNKKTTPIKIFDTLIGLELDKGEYEIELKYTPRGLKLGTIMSIFGLVIYITKRKIKSHHN